MSGSRCWFAFYRAFPSRNADLFAACYGERTWGGVFDEATSALDVPTAEAFAKTINGLRGKVTMLFITHGLPRGLKVDVLFQLSASGMQQVQLAEQA